MTNSPDDPWSPLNEDFETPEYDDDDYTEAMELFGGKPIPKIGEPAEYKDMASRLPPEYIEALIKKYGHIPELNNMVAVDEDEDRPTEEQLRAENRAMQDVPDDELDDEEYYGRHGFSRNAPVCTDPECPCADD